MSRESAARGVDAPVRGHVGPECSVDVTERVRRRGSRQSSVGSGTWPLSSSEARVEAFLGRPLGELDLRVVLAFDGEGLTADRCRMVIAASGIDTGHAVRKRRRWACAKAPPRPLARHQRPAECDLVTRGLPTDRVELLLRQADAPHRGWVAGPSRTSSALAGVVQRCQSCTTLLSH